MEKLKSAQQNEEKIQSEKESLKQKLMQDDMIDEEVADRLISTIGEDLIKQRIQNETREAEASFDKEFNEFDFEGKSAHAAAMPWDGRRLSQLSWEQI